MLAFPPTCPELNLDVRNRTAWAKTKWATDGPERENAHNISSSNRDIYLTPPTPRCSVRGHERGFSEDLVGVGTAL